MPKRIMRPFTAVLALLALLVPAALVTTAPTTTAAPAAVVASVDAPTEADTAPDAGEVVEAPAWTLVAYSDCPAGKSCLWTGANGAGTRKDLAFSSYDPVGTCTTLTLQPVGGYHSARGGFGSGYALAIYSGAGCTGLLDVLWSGDTWSNEFSRVNSVMIT